VTDTDAPAGAGDDGGDVGSPPSPWWRRWWMWAAAAAVVLVAVGMIIWAVQDDDTGEDAAPSTTTTTTTATSTTTTSTTTVTPTTTEAPSTVIARVDGLGPVGLGDAADAALPLLTDLFGAPVSDETETGVSPFGYYTEEEATARLVEWDGLTVAFIDAPLYRNDGVLHFFGWWTDGGTTPPIASAEGIGVGSTLTDARSVFPDTTPHLRGCGPGQWVADLGVPAVVNGLDAALVLTFGALPVPDPWPADETTVPLPPGAGDSEVTEMWTPKIQPC
jgi:hypothetical protein